MICCYLDFDGVLHDECVYSSRAAGIFIATPGRTLFEWMPILEELLAPHPDVKIVLSTSWVHVKGFNFAKRKLSLSLRARVVGTTYDRSLSSIDFVRVPRGRQVLNDVERRKPESWFAIDDDDYRWPQEYRDRLVRTSGDTGLNDPEVQAAIREILRKAQ